jgi:superfamily I DNA/RNA helicase
MNACDLRVLALPAERGVTIFAVRDDEESIYGWRKAARELSVRLGDQSRSRARPRS